MRRAIYCLLIAIALCYVAGVWPLPGSAVGVSSTQEDSGMGTIGEYDPSTEKVACDWTDTLLMRTTEVSMIGAIKDAHTHTSSTDGCISHFQKVNSTADALPFYGWAMPWSKHVWTAETMTMEDPSNNANTNFTATTQAAFAAYSACYLWLEWHRSTGAFCRLEPFTY